MFILVKNVIESFNEKDKFEFSIRKSAAFEGDFKQVKTSPEQEDFSPVTGEVAVYSDNGVEN